MQAAAGDRLNKVQRSIEDRVQLLAENHVPLNFKQPATTTV
jgi:hypothetical protein